MIGPERVRADRDRPGPDHHPSGRIPVTNTSVNPARSLGVAWFAGGTALPRSGCSSSRQSSVRRSPVPPTPLITGAPARCGVGRIPSRSEIRRDGRRSAPCHGWPRPPSEERAGDPAWIFGSAVKRFTRRDGCEMERSARRGAPNRHSAEGGTRTLTPEGTGT